MMGRLQQLYYMWVEDCRWLIMLYKNIKNIYKTIIKFGILKLQQTIQL